MVNLPVFQDVFGSFPDFTTTSAALFIGPFSSSPAASLAVSAATAFGEQRRPAVDFATVLLAVLPAVQAASRIVITFLRCQPDNRGESRLVQEPGTHETPAANPIRLARKACLNQILDYAGKHMQTFLQPDLQAAGIKRLGQVEYV